MSSKISAALAAQCGCRILAAMVTCVMIGCGEPEPTDQLAVTPVTGAVFFQNAPAEGAVVTLHPVSGSAVEAGIYPNGLVDEAGTFQLTTYRQGDGAPAGEYRVTIVWPDESYQPRNPIEREEMAMGGQRPDKLRGKYRVPEKSSFKASIPSGESAFEMPRIDLK